MNLPSVSIIFTNHNGGNNPIDCIKSIKKLNYPQNKIEIIVVDNDSTDNSVYKIKAKYPTVKLILKKSNFGFAKGINIGVKKASGKYLFITNDDIIFEKNSLKYLIEYAINSKKQGIFGGKQLTVKSKKNLSGGRNFNMYTGQHQNLKNEKTIVSCDQIDGCTMLISKKMFKEFKGFDENFSPAYFEDLDLCTRAKKKGYQVTFIPKATFYHKYAQTISKFPLEKVYYIGFKNKLQYFLKHASLIQIISFLLINYFLVTPFRIIAKKEPIIKPQIEALIWNIKNIRKTLKKRD